jgi:predicted component of type VI protein secretion system
MSSIECKLVYDSLASLGTDAAEWRVYLHLYHGTPEKDLIHKAEGFLAEIRENYRRYLEEKDEEDV